MQFRYMNIKFVIRLCWLNPWDGLLACYLLELPFPPNNVILGCISAMPLLIRLLIHEGRYESMFVCYPTMKGDLC